MPRVPTVFACLTMLVVACAEPLSTAPARRSVPLERDAQAAALAPGVPGTPNCEGQTARFVAQGDGGLTGSTGIGGLSSLSGYSVQELTTFIAQYCAGP